MTTTNEKPILSNDLIRKLKEKKHPNPMELHPFEAFEEKRNDTLDEAIEEIPKDHVLVKKGVLDCAIRQNEVLDSICQGKGDYAVIKKKDFDVIWKCRNCGGLMEHQKEIHTFVCLKCGNKEWYPQRQDDKKTALKGDLLTKQEYGYIHNQIMCMDSQYLAKLGESVTENGKPKHTKKAKRIIRKLKSLTNYSFSKKTVTSKNNITANSKIERSNDQKPKQLLEGFADLEHKQWMAWTKYIAKHYRIPKTLRKKWKKNWKPYKQLTEDAKEKDRVWARKVLKELQLGGNND